MADYDDIGVIFHHFHSIVKGFPFFCGSGGGVGEAEERAAEAGDGRFEREASAGGRFEEAGAEDFTLEEMRFRFNFEVIGFGEDGDDILFIEVFDGDKVSIFEY